MRYFKYILIVLFINISALSFSADFYWVGGSGNWNQVSNWRTTSGGNTVPSVIPGPADDVYFDANSGFTSLSNTVTISATSSCRNITFSGSAVTPVLTQSGSQILNIYGSSVWQTGMEGINVSEIYYKNTMLPKTITSNGVTTLAKVYIEEETTTTLSDKFSVSQLYQYAGTFNTAGHDVNILGAYSMLPQSNNINIKAIFNSSTITIGGSFSAGNTTSNLLEIDSGTSTLVFTGTGGSLSSPNAQTFYNVIFENSGGISQTVYTRALVFNRVEFKDDGQINGDNTFNELVFASEKTYVLENGKTQTIVNSFTATTVLCEGWSTIKSQTAGVTAFIFANNPAVINVSGVIMSDITALGSASFVANNSIDNTNNIGWTFTATTNTTLYWVGGSGNWNDRIHWSATSGGAGGYCEPGPFDNTVFDANSGFTTTDKTVTIVNTSYTKNISFIGNGEPPIFNESGTQTLNIYGSSEWQTGMAPISISNIYYRTSNEDKTIKSNGVRTGALPRNNVYLEEAQKITLADNYYTLGVLNLSLGTFDTGNHDIEIAYDFLTTINTNPKVLNLGSSTITLTGEGSRFNTNDANITVNAGTSTIVFTNIVSIEDSALRGFYPYRDQVFYDIIFEKEGQINTGTTGTVYYNTVQFLGNGRIRGTNNYKELLFAPSKKYNLQVNQTQYITDRFVAANPNCTWGSIYCSNEGQLTYINAPATAVIDVSRVVLNDISASGGANFIAIDSYDDGNNPGWDIQSYTGTNLYWVGGAGNWDDINHWADTSGGNGGYCVPGPNDNVFFDVNSGFTSSSNIVRLNVTGYTKNITFNGSVVVPRFLKTNNTSPTLNIYGSSEWQENMTAIDINIVNYKNTNTPKTIKSNGVALGTLSIEVNLMEESEISLLDDLDIGGRVYHTAGTFTTNSYNVKIFSEYRAVSSTSPKILNLGASTITLNSNSASFRTNISDITINAGTSTIVFTQLYTSTLSVLGLYPNSNQTFYNVLFEKEGSLGYESANNVTYNRVEFFGNGQLYGSSTINDLVFNTQKTYILQQNVNQNVTNLILGGTPCATTTIKSSSETIQARLNVTGDKTNFNFVTIGGINSVGKTLYFGAQSSNLGNNSGMFFEPYDPGGYEILGNDWLNHVVNTNISSTHVLTTNVSDVVTNNNTEYTWVKQPDTNVVLGTGPTFDFMPHGYGTYELTIDFKDQFSGDYICKYQDIFTITPGSGMVNPNLKFVAK